MDAGINRGKEKQDLTNKMQLADSEENKCILVGRFWMKAHG